MIEILIPIALFISMVAIVKILDDNKTRRKLIDKGLVGEDVKFLYQSTSQPLSSVKWGLVLIGLGLALLIGQFAGEDISDTITIGLMFLFAGIGFLIYYGIAKKKIKEMEGDNKQNID
ncbi:MAG: DUF6249 domain-containing protein, partial [Calditrichia bacterium]